MVSRASTQLDATLRSFGDAVESGIRVDGVGAGEDDEAHDSEGQDDALEDPRAQEAGLGIGSLFFCALLFRTRLVPRWLAAWGLIGYACFAAGNLLELFGVMGAALVASIPGGVFEWTFAIWLITRGFASTPTNT